MKTYKYYIVDIDCHVVEFEPKSVTIKELNSNAKLTKEDLNIIESVPLNEASRYIFLSVREARKFLNDIVDNRIKNAQSIKKLIKSGEPQPITADELSGRLW